MKFSIRRSQNVSHLPAEGDAGSSGGRRGKGLRRLVSAILLLGLLAAFTRPGKKATRAIARRLDARVECFTEPGSSAYARIFAPIFSRLYVSVASDVVRELKARSGTRSGTRGATIVDLGCGPGDLVVEISRHVKDARITGMDLSPSMLLWAGRHATTDGRVKFLVGDVADMPFDDASVDLVVSTLSMHHWDDPAGVFAEIDRVLQPGGVALIYDLGLLAYTPEEMDEVATAAGLESDDIVRERARGGLVSTFFVRYKVEGVD
jgi:SAM-dependent methyltransferase